MSNKINNNFLNVKIQRRMSSVAIDVVVVAVVALLYSTVYTRELTVYK
jgi:hypothetical protein